MLSCLLSVIFGFILLFLCYIFLKKFFGKFFQLTEWFLEYTLQKVPLERVHKIIIREVFSMRFRKRFRRVRRRLRGRRIRKLYVGRGGYRR